MLRDEDDWFHYSVDFRIGTRYMGEHIVDNFKREAMRNPFLRAAPALGFDLHRLQHHLPQPRAALDLPRQARRPGQGRHPLRRIPPPPAPAPRRRDRRHPRRAAFIAKAEEIYGYEHFVCDTSGSLCEVVDPDDPADPVMSRPRRRHPAGLVPRHRGGPRRARPPLRPRAQADVLPRGLPHPPLDRLLRREGIAAERSIPTPSSATASAR